jgi:hypothetical protein
MWEAEKGRIMVQSPVEKEQGEGVLFQRTSQEQ